MVAQVVARDSHWRWGDMGAPTFARWLVDQMEQAEPGGMKQATLARLVGVEQSMVSRWVRGKSIPSPDNLLTIAQVFRKVPSDVWRIAGVIQQGEPAPLPRPIEEDTRAVLGSLAQQILDHLNYRGDSPKVLDASYHFPTDTGRALAAIMAASDSERRPVMVYRVASRPEVVATLTAPSIERQVGVMSAWVPHVRDDRAPVYAMVVDGDGMGNGFVAGDVLYVQPTGEVAPGGVRWEVGDHVVGAMGERAVTGWVRDGQSGPVLVDDETSRVSDMTGVAVVGVIVSRQRPERDRTGQPQEVGSGGMS